MFHYVSLFFQLVHSSSGPSLIHRIITPLVNVTDFHPLLEPVGNGALPVGSALGESNRATKGTGSSAVAHTGNTDVVDTGHSGVAGHASGHLDNHFKLS